MRDKEKNTNPALRNKSGVTIIEIMVVTTVIAILAALSFPAFKIMQQREKERRLKDILLTVNGAISGCKTARAGKLYSEGFRNYVKRKGFEKIEEAYPTDMTAQHLAKKRFINNGIKEGRFYPASPTALIFGKPFQIKISSSTTATPLAPASELVTITVDRKFIRHIPPHPFSDWYPNAHWEFRAAEPIGGNTYASGPVLPDAWSDGTASGVMSIVSRGAGQALDGSNTDNWP